MNHDFATAFNLVSNFFVLKGACVRFYVFPIFLLSENAVGCALVNYLVDKKGCFPLFSIEQRKQGMT